MWKGTDSKAKNRKVNKMESLLWILVQQFSSDAKHGCHILYREPFWELSNWSTSKWITWPSDNGCLLLSLTEICLSLVVKVWSMNWLCESRHWAGHDCVKPLPPQPEAPFSVGVQCVCGVTLTMAGPSSALFAFEDVWLRRVRARLHYHRFSFFLLEGAKWQSVCLNLITFDSVT